MTWDLNQLETLLADNQDLVVTKEENCLLVANSDGIDAWLAISGEQILVESLLFSKLSIHKSCFPKNMPQFSQLIINSATLGSCSKISQSLI